MEQYKCEFCDQAFEKFQQKANHVRWHHKTEDFYNKTKAKLSGIANRNNDLKLGSHIHEITTCHKCTNLMTIQYRPGKRKDRYYCSRSCANSRGPRSDDAKKKLRENMLNLWKSGYYDNTTAKNHLKQRKMFSSKVERYIVDYFRKTFPNDEWTFGGGLYVDDRTHISRDLYSNKLKICFEYDGIWHFKDIHGQLDGKQRKDRLLEDWCRDNDYRLIRIDEAAYIDINQIVDLIYNRSEMLIKVGERY
jgi:hypothetical protein